MPITRRALLIANPGEIGDEQYCKGVFVDIKNYLCLLKSPVGGAWEDREIKYLKRPTVAAIKIWLRLYSKIDYLFIMFTGHGEYSNIKKDRILELRRGHEIASNDLICGARKSTIILDCCQEVQAASPIEKVGRLINLSEATELREPNTPKCRHVFLKLLECAPEGVVRLVSCSIGERSYDSDEMGGRYNSSFIDCIDAFARREARIPLSLTNAHLSALAAHSCAARKTHRRTTGLQTPVIERSSPYVNYPVAVFV